LHERIRIVVTTSWILVRRGCCRSKVPRVLS